MQKMGKKKNNSEEKTFTIDEVDEMTLAQFRAGNQKGMYDCYDIFKELTSRLKQSSSDVWAIYNLNLITPDKKKVVDQMEFAINLLDTLEDMFQDYYDIKLDDIRRGDTNDESEEF